MTDVYLPTVPESPIPRLIRQLISLRRRAGLSQATLAKRLGTTQSAVSEFETGESSPTLATLSRYAAEFGMEIVVTLEGDVD